MAFISTHGVEMKAESHRAAMKYKIDSKTAKQNNLNIRYVKNTKQYILVELCKIKIHKLHIYQRSREVCQNKLSLCNSCNHDFLHAGIARCEENCY